MDLDSDIVFVSILQLVFGIHGDTRINGDSEWYNIIIARSGSCSQQKTFDSTLFVNKHSGPAIKISKRYHLHDLSK